VHAASATAEAETNKVLSAADLKRMV